MYRKSRLPPPTVGLSTTRNAQSYGTLIPDARIRATGLPLAFRRLHPKKRRRPIASNQLSSNVALVVSATLSIFGIVFAFILEPLFGCIATGYLTTMIAYTLLLKQIIVLDVLAISAGFVLRAVAGATVIQAPISVWLYICTGLGALFIALVKRRSELESAAPLLSGLTAFEIRTPSVPENNEIHDIP